MYHKNTGHASPLPNGITGAGSDSAPAGPSTLSLSCISEALCVVDTPWQTWHLLYHGATKHAPQQCTLSTTNPGQLYIGLHPLRRWAVFLPPSPGQVSSMSDSWTAAVFHEENVSPVHLHTKSRSEPYYGALESDARIRAMASSVRQSLDNMTLLNVNPRSSLFLLPSFAKYLLLSAVFLSSRGEKQDDGKVETVSS